MDCPLCHGVGMVRRPFDVEFGGWEECPHCHPPAPRTRGPLARLWRRFLARFRLNLAAVCEESRGRGPTECYHDYPDSVHGYPEHFATLACKRCGKEFTI